MRWPKSRPAPAAPSPSNAELWFLAFALTSLVASAVQATIRRHILEVEKCRNKNPHKVSDCKEAILKFEEATSELRKCATVALHSGGQLRFPGFARRAAAALVAYNEALEALLKCLGCDAVVPLSF